MADLVRCYTTSYQSAGPQVYVMVTRIFKKDKRAGTPDRYGLAVRRNRIRQLTDECPRSTRLRELPIGIVVKRARILVRQLNIDNPEIIRLDTGSFASRTVVNTRTLA